MCGIVGVVGNITNEDKLIFSQMLKFDTDRGPHSTGFFGVQKKDNVVVSKEVGTPWEFFRKSPLVNVKGEFFADYKIMVGHNRWATVGEVNKENAHPFDVGNVVGVHNGTIDGWASMKWLEENGSKHAVDSCMLFSAIEKHGLKGTIPNITGAWSVVFYNKKEKTINFFRNKERPMCYAWSEDGATLYFASEAWIISFATKLYGRKVKKIYNTDEDTHFFANNDATIDNGNIKFRYYKEKLVGKPKPPVTVVSYTSGNSWDANSFNYLRNRVLKQGTDPDGFCAFSGGKEVKLLNDWNTYAKVYVPTLIGKNHIHIWVDKRKYEVEEVVKYLQESEGYFMAIPSGISQTGSKESDCYILMDWSEAIIPLSWDEPLDLPEEKANENQTVIEYVVVNGHTSVTKEDFNKAMKEGCAFCGDNSSTHLDSHKIHWVSYPTQYLCPSCTTHNNHKYI